MSLQAKFGCNGKCLGIFAYCPRPRASPEPPEDRPVRREGPAHVTGDSTATPLLLLALFLVLPTVVCDLAGIHTDTYTVSRRWHWLMWSHASKHAHEQPGVDSSSGSRESGGTRARDVLPLSLAKERKKDAEVIQTKQDACCWYSI